MDKKHWIVLCCLVALLSACTATLPPVADQAGLPQTVTPAIVPGHEAQSGPAGSLYSTGKKSDEELFSQALNQIAGPFNQDASATARQTLEALLSGYPQSKWSSAARTILRLIGELDTYRVGAPHAPPLLPAEQNMVQKLATDRSKTLRENEQLKKEVRLLSEKYQAELAELQQENEQLKNDLQLLKNLEIQLDRREKMLR